MKRQLLALSLLTSTTFGALASPTPALAAYNETEPANTSASATVLPDFTSTTSVTQRYVHGAHQSGNPDYYCFDVTNEHFMLQLRFSSTSASKPVVADFYQDANENGRVDAGEYVGSFSSDTSQGLTLQGMDDGRYFVSFASGGAFDYVFAIKVNPSFQTQREVEPNNSYSQANKLTGSLVGNRFLDGVVNGGPSVLDFYDWYTFDLFDRRLNVILFQPTTSTSNLRLDLYQDANFNGILESNEWRGGGPTNSQGYVVASHDQPSYGKYFVRVRKLASGSQYYGLTLDAYR